MEGVKGDIMELKVGRVYKSFNDIVYRVTYVNRKNEDLRMDYISGDITNTSIKEWNRATTQLNHWEDSAVDITNVYDSKVGRALREI
jgi:hypothetical protein